MSSINVIVENIVRNEIKPLKDEILSLKRERETEYEGWMIEYKRQCSDIKKNKKKFTRLKSENEKLTKTLANVEQKLETIQNHVYFIENNTADSVNLYATLRKEFTTYPDDDEMTGFLSYTDEDLK
tara:strand:+ start:605 stop:982 length:378 start_codon:yes stop_codon:yes gene_type:complete